MIIAQRHYSFQTTFSDSETICIIPLHITAHITVAVLGIRALIVIVHTPVNTVAVTHAYKSHDTFCIRIFVTFVAIIFLLDLFSV